VRRCHVTIAVCCRPVVRPRIYLGASASPAKVATLQNAGADITCHGHDVVEAEIEARRVAEHDGAVYCSPYNDLKVLSPFTCCPVAMSTRVLCMCKQSMMQG
jgi:threonine dehydratase